MTQGPPNTKHTYDVGSVNFPDIEAKCSVKDISSPTRPSGKEIFGIFSGSFNGDDVIFSEIAKGSTRKTVEDVSTQIQSAFQFKVSLRRYFALFTELKSESHWGSKDGHDTTPDYGHLQRWVTNWIYENQEELETVLPPSLKKVAAIDEALLCPFPSLDQI